MTRNWSGVDGGENNFNLVTRLTPTHTHSTDTICAYVLVPPACVVMVPILGGSCLVSRNKFFFFCLGVVAFFGSNSTLPSYFILPCVCVYFRLIFERIRGEKFDVVSGHPLRCTILITFLDSFRRRWLLLRKTFYFSRLDSPPVQLGKWAIPVLSCGLHFYFFLNHTV